MTLPERLDRLISVLLVLLTAAEVVEQWRLASLGPLVPALTAAVLGLLSLRVTPSRRAFVAVGVALVVALALTGQDWSAIGLRSLGSAAFIGGFFTALSTLRNVAETSPAIRAAGRFLAAQPPGRRYAALTLGGHLFALLLNYGSISLLGSLASASARAEPDPFIRGHRTRRMLLAIQRGFISCLPWSPLGFAMAIINTVVPGASWASAALPGAVSAAIIAGTGWAHDSVFKPRRPAGMAPFVFAAPDGSWRLLAPLLLLLLLLGLSVGSLHIALGIPITGVVMLVVPVIALGWALMQHQGGRLDFALEDRLRRYLTVELPAARGEITLLMMAGFIGTAGAPLLGPLMAGMGADTSALPPWLVLAAFVWVIPVLGQVGMNPILAVTLIAPLIPAPESMGVSPAAVVTAIGAGWAVSGISSPFTATTLLIGSFGGVSALHVGLRWNGSYVLLVSLLLTAWVLLYAFAIG